MCVSMKNRKDTCSSHHAGLRSIAPEKWFSTCGVALLLPQWPVAVSGDITGCPRWGECYGHSVEVARSAAKHHIMSRMALPQLRMMGTVGPKFLVPFYMVAMRSSRILVPRQVLFSLPQQGSSFLKGDAPSFWTISYFPFGLLPCHSNRHGLLSTTTCPESYLTLLGSGKLCKAHGLPSFLGSAALLLIKWLSWVLANSQQVATTSRRIFSSDYPLRTFCRQLEEEEAPTDIFRGPQLTRMGDWDGLGIWTGASLLGAQRESGIDGTGSGHFGMEVTMGKSWTH